MSHIHKQKENPIKRVSSSDYYFSVTAPCCMLFSANQFLITAAFTTTQSRAQRNETHKFAVFFSKILMQKNRWRLEHSRNTEIPSKKSWLRLCAQWYYLMAIVRPLLPFHAHYMISTQSIIGSFNNYSVTTIQQPSLTMGRYSKNLRQLASSTRLSKYQLHITEQ